MARPSPRRTKRLNLRVPVRVYGVSPNREPFREETHTLLLNAHGAMITLAAEVELGQSIVVLNRATSRQEECRVAYVGPRAVGKARVGFAFQRPAVSFWEILFPPLEAKPLALAARPV